MWAGQREPESMSQDNVDLAATDVRLRSVVHAAGIIVGAFATAILLTVVALNLAVLAGVEIEPGSLEENVLGSVAQFGGFLIAALAYLGYRDDATLVRWGWPTLGHVALMIGGFVALFLVNVGAGLIATTFGFESADNAVVVAGNENPELFLYMIPITVLLVAPGEELIFRGVVQGWFRRAYGVVPGILLASAIFGAIHFVAVLGDGALVYIVVAAGLGIVLGAIYEYTENIVVPIVVHGLYNALLFSIQYLVAAGYVQAPA